MRTDVIGRNFEVTPAIRAHAEGKAEKLHKFLRGVQQITFRLARVDHQHKGQFEVELVIDVERHDDFVAHAKGEDLYVLIDEAVQKGTRQLTEFKERRKDGSRQAKDTE
ncbi:MAG: ribosome-associated translation inhibitor RaiA [Phycisphaerales bacterium]|nr:ribosome-associated translation inhibitor RaiA [Phycisphaerales bacterium]